MTDQLTFEADLSAETALLYCLLIDPAMLSEVELAPADFLSAQNATIFRTIRQISGEGVAVDIITVAEALNRESNRNWLPILAGITSSAGSPSNARSYAEIIKALANQRQAAKVGNFLAQNAGKEGSIAEAIRMLMEIGRDRAPTEYDLNEVLKLSVAEVDRAFKNSDSIIGISTGLKDLDDILGGYHPGDLVIIGARPSVGKTAVMLNQMIGANKYVGCISGEQGVAQIGQRLLAMAGKVSLMGMRNGRMREADWDALMTGATKLKVHPGMRFNDRPSPTMDEVEASARRWKYENDIAGLYLDYLQRIKTDSKKKRFEGVGDNVRRCKELARELAIPVVALAQVSREAEGRRPNMRDLSDSSEIEKEADLIIFLFRETDSEKPGHTIMEFNIEKNRHGPTGLVRAVWDPRFLKISDMDFSERRSA